MPESQTLADQSALVTGADSGIGRGVALALARAGATLGINFHANAEAAAEVVKEIEAAGGRAIALQADVGDEKGVATLFERFIAFAGGLDLLVGNAGLQDDAALGEMTLAKWNKVLGTNLTGQFLCAQAAVRAFRARGKRAGARTLGKIVFVSSVHEVIPWAGHVNYATAKGGLSMMMKTLAQELAPEGIRINSVAPGAIRTPINRAAWETPEALAKLLQLIPQGRIGEPADVGEAVRWLCSDASDYVNGTCLTVDGGMELYPGFAGNG